jgi:molybdopterin-containing oxidoreductase family iron-sulfur binding subunit
VPIREFKTACQQACPSDSLVFGNIRDPQSAVSHTRQSDRGYVMLKYLNTQPRVSYLARIKNPNSEMPDASRVGMANGEPHGHGAEDHGTKEHDVEEHDTGDRHETEEPTHH